LLTPALLLAFFLVVLVSALVGKAVFSVDAFLAVVLLPVFFPAIAVRPAAVTLAFAVAFLDVTFAMRLPAWVQKFAAQRFNSIKLKLQSKLD
jgi:hypothetical protein